MYIMDKHLNNSYRMHIVYGQSFNAWQLQVHCALSMHDFHGEPSPGAICDAPAMTVK